MLLLLNFMNGVPIDEMAATIDLQDSMLKQAENIETPEQEQQTI